MAAAAAGEPAHARIIIAVSEAHKAGIGRI